ncbi:uncharacterized protein L203_101729 [Cryptococcus depauperatus CBS 7841]|uniref:Ribosomal eL28/Mak16 domain-containing protein n=1 Tax=Cryptococcus depauperatus CBS 7841 TaxID=1295531 RepID=A0A1E3HP66_9TREE|nr:50S small subunit ribosomal protein L28e [Cryptococcus depauperatus CBS 7841]ODN94901.1 50S small subunit ribosomal protein L28e [Cryptococcus depauperatus CBS 7855]
MSADLTWLLVRNWNSFQVKGGHGPVFSKEKGNLLNKSSHKYSGLANSKVVNIYSSPAGGITITKIKADAKPNQVASARSHVALKRSTGPRKAAKIAATETASKGYRADLRPIAVARATTLLRAQCRDANPPRKFFQSRAARRRTAASATEGNTAEDVTDVE